MQLAALDHEGTEVPDGEVNLEYVITRYENGYEIFKRLRFIF